MPLVNLDQVRNVEDADGTPSDAITHCRCDQRMLDRERFKHEICDRERSPRRNRAPLTDRIPLQAVPCFSRRIHLAWRSMLQTTGVIGMSVSEHNSLGLKCLEFAEPICSTVDEDTSLDQHTAVHPVQSGSSLNLAARSWEGKFQDRTPLMEALPIDWLGARPVERLIRIYEGIGRSKKDRSRASDCCRMHVSNCIDPGPPLALINLAA